MYRLRAKGSLKLSCKDIDMMNSEKGSKVNRKGAGSNCLVCFMGFSCLRNVSILAPTIAPTHCLSLLGAVLRFQARLLAFYSNLIAIGPFKVYDHRYVEELNCGYCY